MTLTIGSLFSGYGGLDLAVEAALGATPAWFVEYDDAPSRILAHHWPDVPNYGDVTTVDWSAMPRVDVITGGYPCQPFSAAGQRKGTSDERHLWPYVREAIRHLRPRLVLLENVAGHRSLGLDRVLGDMAEDGMCVWWTSIRASDIGAPHHRERLFILAAPADSSGGTGSVSDGDDVCPRCDEGRLRPSAGRGDVLADSGRVGRGEGAEQSGPGEKEVAAAVGADAPPPDSGRPTVGEHAGEPPAEEAGEDDGHRPGDPRGERPAQVGREGTADAGGEELHSRRGLRETEPETLRQRRPGHSHNEACNWGPYAAAIRRWERLTRPAPDPTELNRNNKPRLAAPFAEWMMGLPEGHVTQVPGISRSDQLKAIGNGVCPQQAAAALHQLLTSPATAGLFS